jgi:hypothetical protein
METLNMGNACSMTITCQLVHISTLHEEQEQERGHLWGKLCLHILHIFFEHKTFNQQERRCSELSHAKLLQYFLCTRVHVFVNMG